MNGDDRDRKARSGGWVRAFWPSALAAATVWSCWPLIREMVDRWSHDPRYSHGFIVPAFAVYLLWLHRSERVTGAPRPVWGLALVAAGGFLLVAGARYYLFWVEAVSLLPALAGLALLTGGWPALRWSARSILFLVFMFPLPYRVETAMGGPLQNLATAASVFALQTAGLAAVPEGNVIHMGETRIGVVEACNGLGMLLTFSAFATAAVLVTRRSTAERVIILASAAPIALAANVARITGTGLLHGAAGGAAADAFFHDLAGWLMMPLAVAAFGAELAVLDRLFVEPTSPPPEAELPADGLPPGPLEPLPAGG